MDRTFVDGLVSVITPVYNAERFITTAVESVMKQTYKNIEIILVDDCSNDSSAGIINELCKKYPNIVYHLQEKNMGAGVARNKALELAQGQYAAFLDSDDIWKEEKIAKQIELMQKTGAPLCYTAIEMIDESGSLVKSKRKVKEICDYSYLLHNTVIPTSGLVVDRKQCGDFRMHLRRGGQDYATWLKLMRNGAVARGIDEALVQYRMVSGSLSSNKFKSIQQVWEIQTQDEKIGKIPAAFHVLCFTLNALRKYLF
ncbi:MAG: glycosyltransferase family 2 protein [Clostridia bacterium]|nr:glycosyltransferase family 2 protein [Clostridia bacterium]